MTRMKQVMARGRHPLALVVAAVLVGGVLAGGAIASASSTTVKGVPWPARSSKIVLYVDTEAGAVEGTLGDCEQANLFQRGQTILFRAAAVQSSTGKTLLPAQVRTFKVEIPGEASVPLTFGEHSYGVKTGSLPPDYWTGIWKVPAKYPLGVVNFTVHVSTRTTPSESVSWHQIPIVASSLTIVKA